jgi:hypothetical protein
MQQWSADGTRQERSGWRDQALSRRHRDWGFNCPAVDLDFLMVEYNVGKPVGLIEYKHYLAREPNLQHATYRALAELANLSKLPFLIGWYWPDIWAFKIRPVNAIAAQSFQHGEILTEREFVRRIYRMRRLVLTEYLESFLKNELPPDDDEPADAPRTPAPVVNGGSLGARPQIQSRSERHEGWPPNGDLFGK